MQQSVLSKLTLRVVLQGLLHVEEPVEARRLFAASPAAQLQVQVKVLATSWTTLDQHCSGSVATSAWRVASNVAAPVPHTTSLVEQSVSATWTLVGSTSTPVGISASTRDNSVAENVLKTTLSVAIDAATPTSTAFVGMNASVRTSSAMASVQTTSLSVENRTANLPTQ